MGNMRFDPQRSTIIIVGSWNQAIFTENFVQDRVLRVPEKVTMEIGMTPYGWIPRFTGGSLQLTVARERVVWTPLDAAAETLRRMEEASINLLSHLQVTPVTAVGINFGFETDQPTERLQKEVAYEDLYAHKESLELDPQSITSKISFDAEDRTMTVSVEGSTREQTISLDVNFHKPVRDAQGAIEALRGRTEWARTRTLAFLQAAWGLEL